MHQPVPHLPTWCWCTGHSETISSPAAHSFQLPAPLAGSAAWHRTRASDYVKAAAPSGAQDQPDGTGFAAREDLVARQGPPTLSFIPSHPVPPTRPLAPTPTVCGAPGGEERVTESRSAPEHTVQSTPLAGRSSARGMCGCGDSCALGSRGPVADASEPQFPRLQNRDLVISPRRGRSFERETVITVVRSGNRGEGTSPLCHPCLLHIVPASESKALRDAAS